MGPGLAQRRADGVVERLADLARRGRGPGRATALAGVAIGGELADDQHGRPRVADRLLLAQQAQVADLARHPRRLGGSVVVGDAQQHHETGLVEAADDLAGDAHRGGAHPLQHCSHPRILPAQPGARDNGFMSDETHLIEPAPSAAPSPLLGLPGAVGGEGVDAAVAAHYGSFNGEQRHLARGEGFVDLSHRGVVRVSGPDRLTWLHSLTTQQLEGLAPGVPTTALVLSPNGHVEHALHAVDDGESLTAHVEPGEAGPLVTFLDRMRFMMRVEVEDVTEQVAVCWRASPVPEGKFDLVPRDQLEAYAAAAGPAAGLWAYEALRIARGEPRLGLDTDHRTIPNEVGWIDSAVHLDKGCYRGQETVARVHNLGRPPRRLTLLHLDGSDNRLPARASAVTLEGRQVGTVGTSARHHELGPIALALLKRNTPVDAQLEVDGLPAMQEVVVDPDVGLHFRAR